MIRVIKGKAIHDTYPLQRRERHRWMLLHVLEMQNRKPSFGDAMLSLGST